MMETKKVSRMCYLQMQRRVGKHVGNVDSGNILGSLDQIVIIEGVRPMELGG
jgi:hypothetical protein